jgi:hypothetical protein
MKKAALLVAILLAMSGCGRSGPKSAVADFEPASPNMNVPLTLLQLQMTCDDIASIILISLSNRMRNIDIFQTKDYALTLANTFDKRFPELPEERRLIVRKIYLQTVSDQYMAPETTLKKQLDAYRIYGEDKFRTGATNVCKRGLSNLPDNAPLPTMQFNQK